MSLSLDTTVRLRSGLLMPLFGLGTWLSESGGEASESVLAAIGCGTRLIDTAAMYENEEDIGKALGEVSGPLPFVVTKLKSDSHGDAGAREGLKASLSKVSGCGSMDVVALMTIVRGEDRHTRPKRTHIYRTQQDQDNTH